MKKIILTLAGFLFLFSASANAQQPKFGYINLQEVVSLMPERTEAQTQLQKINDDYASMLELMQVEFNNKVQEYQKNMSTYSDAVKQVKERELQDLDTRMQELYTTANKEPRDQEQRTDGPHHRKGRERHQEGRQGQRLPHHLRRIDASYGVLR